MFYLADNKTIGAYLKNLLKVNNYKTTADFCRAYLRKKNKRDEFSETELQIERTRFGNIF